MEEPKYIIILITMDSKKEAEQIAHVLLEHKKAACVNILSGVDSYFWWENNIDSAREILLVVKSKASLLSEIIDLVKKTHSYEVPEVIAMPIIGGNQDYLDWIDKNVS